MESCDHILRHQCLCPPHTQFLTDRNEVKKHFWWKASVFLFVFLGRRSNLSHFIPSWLAGVYTDWTALDGVGRVITFQQEGLEVLHTDAILLLQTDALWVQLHQLQYKLVWYCSLAGLQSICLCVFVSGVNPHCCRAFVSSWSALMLQH